MSSFTIKSVKTYAVRNQEPTQHYNGPGNVHESVGGGRGPDIGPS